MKKTLLSIFFASTAMLISAQDYVSYFSDDFEWLNPWAEVGSSGKPAGDTIGEDNVEATAPQMATPKIDGVSAADALKAKGYTFVAFHHDAKPERVPEKQMYIQKNYIKFGLTGYQTGIVLPAIDGVPAGVDLTLSFSTSSMRQGSGKWDATELVVIVENGSDVKTYGYPIPNPGESNPFQWYQANIELTGATVTKDTKITIRNIDSQCGDKGTLRWFIDNIDIHSGNTGAVSDIAVDNNAPVEYFNLLGIRVENPENGIYIRRQAGKVSKVLVK